MTDTKNLKNFLKGYSIEVTPSAAAKIDSFSDALPKGTRVYIAHIEGTPIEDMLVTAKKINEQGFKAMPHFPARIIKDKNILSEWIEKISGRSEC